MEPWSFPLVIWGGGKEGAGFRPLGHRATISLRPLEAPGPGGRFTLMPKYQYLQGLVSYPVHRTQKSHSELEGVTEQEKLSPPSGVCKAEEESLGG